MDKTISLVLGSGGARGLAHIGVLHYLDEHGYEIAYIAGTSIGALIGGIYASGKLDDYERWVSALTRRDIVRLLDWSFSQGSLFKGDRIIGELKSLLGETSIEDLAVDYTAVATDLNTGREVWLTQGPLWDAVRASIAVPLVFAPVRHHGKLLVDGGLVNPIPIAPTFSSRASRTFAVDLNGPRIANSDLPARAEDSEAEEPSDDPGLRERIARFIDGLTDGLPSIDFDTPAAMELAMRSMDAMQTTISRMKLAGYSPDVVITIPRNIATFFDFDRAPELIDYGYRAAESVLQRQDD